MKKLSDYKSFYMLVSVFLAFLLWLYVIDVEDPERSELFRDVTINVTGENILQSQGLTITSLSETEVDLQISAPFSVLSQLHNTNFSVSLDVSKLSTQGNFDLSYTLEIPSHISTNNLVLESRNPTQITVSVDKLYSQSYPINLVFRGSVAEGYQAGQHTISPETITLNGSVDAVSQVDRVVVVLEQEEMQDRFSGELPVMLLDKNGDEIDDPSIEISETSAYVTQPIVMEREIPLVVNFLPGGGATEEHISH